VPITQLSPEALQDMLTATPDLFVLDVRTPEEYAYLGHIPGANLLPLHQLPSSFSALNKDIPMVVTCQHGVRSMDACWFLEQAGFDKLYNFTEGMSVWQGAIERAPLPG
jgi:rhodanese-related sulfurtransferase